MKKLLPLFITIMSIYLCVASSASTLSPAIDIISKRLEMKRCITQNEAFNFDEDTFDSYFGENTSSITVNALPSASNGILTCGGFSPLQGQTISRDSFSLLSFEPAEEFSGVTDFVFESNNRLLYCSILVSPQINQAPVTGNQSISTQKNIAVFKTFSAADPENDSLSFEIVKYPRHGSISINDADGMFVYVPKNGYLGNDSFYYRAVDAFGNKSNRQKVEIRVSKPACDVYFDDMENHWAHNSAVKMASTGLMAGSREDGKLVFNPDENMTRGDFLALSLITAGFESSIPFADKTVFDDDTLIPANIKSYAQYAYDNGIINGCIGENSTINFESDSPITRAQAAVITSRILGLAENDSSDSSLYTDASSIPVWASEGIANLTACGILKGTPTGFVSAEKVLSRAEGAEIICNVSQYLEDKKQQEKETKKTIFNLFGLIK